MSDSDDSRNSSYVKHVARAIRSKMRNRSELHCMLADAAERMAMFSNLSDHTHTCSDERDIEVLRYLAAYRTLKSDNLPHNKLITKELRTEVKQMVEQLHAYICEHYVEELVHGQVLARLIANPRSKGTSGLGR